MNLYILCSLLIMTRSIKFFRLTTDSQSGMKSTLAPGDLLTSTLGNFRVRLIMQTCQLRIEEFGGRDYRIKGYFPEDASKMPCGYVRVKSGVLLTETEVAILKIKYYQLKQFSQTTFTIDDLGVLRLAGLSRINSENIEQQPQQVWVSSFRSPNNYLYSTSNVLVGNGDSMSLVVNEGWWGFTARNGEFRIFNTDNPSQITRYRYNSFTINPGQIFDRYNHGPPASSLEGLNYGQRCGDVFYMDFQFPLLFKIDKYWPQLRVIDQGGYQLLSIRYPSYDCITDLQINPIEERQQCVSWFCPQATFQFEGQCILICPLPYYYQIKPNSKNRCVLNCEQGSIINQTSRICSCGGGMSLPKCPRGSKQYPLGCYCQEGYYYNGLVCSRQCSLGEINMSLPASTNLYNGANIEVGGVCIKCPYKCSKCQMKTKKPIKTYLTCIECMPGYSIFAGVCKKQCQKTIQLSALPLPIQQYISAETSVKTVDINCESACSIQFCEKCSKIMRNTNMAGVANKNSTKQYCVDCMMPLILFKNTCLKKCPQRYILRTTSSFRFYCQQIKNCQNYGIPSDSNNSQTALSNDANSTYKQCSQCNYLSFVCWTDCEKGSFFNNQSQCFCLHSRDTANDKYNYGYSSTCSASKISDDNSTAPNTTLGNKTVQKQKQLKCQINWYEYKFTNECLACPFGCLTCLHDSYGFIQCTSCSPSYFLMIDVNQTHYCQRDTSLTLCQLKYGASIQKQYLPQFKVCDYAMPNTMTNVDSPRTSTVSNPLYSKQQRTRCRQKDPYCLTCLFQSSKTCTYCSSNYYLYNSKCVRNCPSNTTQYQKICIQNRIEYCQRGAIVQHFYLMNLSQNSIYLMGYDYFLPNAFSTFNKVIDPIGNVFLYANLYSRDIGSRVASYPYGVYKCIECIDGYGLNIWTGLCQKCFQESCLECVNSIENRCYKCIDNYKLDGNYVCVQKSQQEKNCLVGQFKNQWKICTNVCNGFWVKQGGNIVNCSRYCHNNYQYQKYYRVQEDQNHTASYLLCIPQDKTPNPKPILSLILTIHRLSSNLILLIFTPLQHDIHPIAQTTPNLVTIFELVKKNSGKFSYQQLNKEHILSMTVQTNRILVILRKSEDLIAVRFDVKRLYAQLGTSEAVQTRNLQQYDQKYGGKLKQEKQGSKLFLTQSEYMFTPDTVPYYQHLSRSLSIPLNIVIILTFIMSLLYISQELIYKTDNLIILLQTLPLFIYSINIHLLDITFYQYFYNFKLIIFNMGSSFDIQSVGNTILSRVVGDGMIYSESTRMNMLAMLAGDGNIVRHCLGFLIALGVIMVVGFICGKCCMKDQVAVFWKKKRENIQLQTQDSQIKLHNQYLHISSQNLTNQNVQILTPNTHHHTNKQLISIDKPFKEQEIYMKQKQSQTSNKKEERRMKSRSRYKARHHKHKTEIKTTTYTLNNMKTVEFSNKNIDTKTSRATANNGAHMQSDQTLGQKIRSTIHKLTHPGKQFHKYLPIDFDHYNKIKLFLTFYLEASSIFLVYFSIVTLTAHPIYFRNYQSKIDGARTLSIVVSVVVLIFFILYAGVRWWAHRIGGIYMLKRVAMGIALGLIQGAAWKVIFCSLIELLFMLFRIIIEELPFILNMKTSEEKLDQQPETPPKIQKKTPLIRRKSSDKEQAAQPQSKVRRKGSLDYKSQHRSQVGQFIPLRPIMQQQSSRISRNQKLLAISDECPNYSLNLKENRKKSKSQNNSCEIEIVEIRGSRDKGSKLKEKTKIQQKNEKENLQKQLQAKKKNNNGHTENKQTPKKTNDMKLKIKKIRHTCKPYTRLVGLLQQELLLIVVYILLSFTDQFSISYNQYEQISNNKTTYSAGLFATVIYITIIICVYLVQFGFQLMSLLIDSWVKIGLSEKQKKRREGMLEIDKLRKYWMEEEQILGRKGKKKTKLKKRYNISNSYIKYYNEFTYKEYPIETAHNYLFSLDKPEPQPSNHRHHHRHKQNKNKTKEEWENEKDILNYQVSSHVYEYIY